MTEPQVLRTYIVLLRNASRLIEDVDLDAVSAALERPEELAGLAEHDRAAPTKHELERLRDAAAAFRAEVAKG